MVKKSIELYYKNKLYVLHLRTFDCITYFYISKDQYSKLESKKKKIIFIGYYSNKKLYYIYDSTKNITNRNIIFNESKIEYQKIKNKNNIEEPEDIFSK